MHTHAQWVLSVVDVECSPSWPGLGSLMLIQEQDRSTCAVVPRRPTGYAAASSLCHISRILSSLVPVGCALGVHLNCAQSAQPLKAADHILHYLWPAPGSGSFLGQDRGVRVRELDEG
jgi:hypothetical protein